MRNIDQTSDLLAMRAAVRTGDRTRIAELRAEGRGACCEFHRYGGLDAAEPRAILTDQQVLQIAVDFWNREADEAERITR